MEELVQKIEDFLSGRPEILLLFLFGSAVKSGIRADSDIDLAIYFKDESKPSPEYMLEIADQISSITGHPTDIVILNDASPIIRMQVLKNGKLLIEKDHQLYLNFFVSTINEYDDLKRIRAIAEKNILKGRIYGR